MDLSKLAPGDAAVALRSLERRYRAVFAGLGDEESPDDIARRRAGSGWTPLEHVVAAAWAIAACGRALARVLREDTPELDATDVDPGLRDRPKDPSGTVHERLAELGLEANALADVVDAVPAGDWERVGTVADSSARRVSALDIVRSAVDAGVTHLRSAERAVAEVRA
jgi:hypothetical protein